MKRLILWMAFTCLIAGVCNHHPKKLKGRATRLEAQMRAEFAEEERKRNKKRILENR